jgi:hypothetical protein
MVPGLVAGLLAFAGDVTHAEAAATWPLQSLELGDSVHHTEGDSPRACAEVAEATRRRFERGPITEVDVYRGMGDAFGALAAMQLAAFVPTLGLHLQRGSRAPGFAISWPASIPLGPVTACRISPSSGELQEFRALRLVIEPALVVRRPWSIFLRPGIRAIWHRSAWRVGFGGGLGSTLAWIDGDRVAASVSPELSVHVGRCCGPGYLLINVRVDRYYPRREPDSALVNLGFAFW